MQKLLQSVFEASKATHTSKVLTSGYGQIASAYLSRGADLG